jgi:hypothetical protein
MTDMMKDAYCRSSDLLNKLVVAVNADITERGLKPGHPLVDTLFEVCEANLKLLSGLISEAEEYLESHPPDAASKVALN